MNTYYSFIHCLRITTLHNSINRTNKQARNETKVDCQQLFYTIYLPTYYLCTLIIKKKSKFTVHVLCLLISWFFFHSFPKERRLSLFFNLPFHLQSSPPPLPHFFLPLLWRKFFFIENNGCIFSLFVLRKKNATISSTRKTTREKGARGRTGSKIDKITTPEIT